eukprot:1142218-Pelagomonas_calceolata.AAC.2
MLNPWLSPGYVQPCKTSSPLVWIELQSLSRLSLVRHAVPLAVTRVSATLQDQLPVGLDRFTIILEAGLPPLCRLLLLCGFLLLCGKPRSASGLLLLTTVLTTER